MVQQLVDVYVEDRLRWNQLATTRAASGGSIGEACPAADELESVPVRPPLKPILVDRQNSTNGQDADQSSPEHPSAYKKRVTLQ